MSFWDVVWFIVITFAFTAYLIMLFSIVADLFRDRETSGLVKAVWLLALLFLPLLTALVYVIARGRGMADRMVSSHVAAQKQQEAYIRQVASPASPTDQIAQASAMLDKGTISQSEFDTLKAKALAV
ncbi:phospholipase D-like protein [Kribbella steppae]|uniref:Phospholipase D-like protein n=1 Tax=Kribbella steppae TaxID=2512223 RepID=A0A4R2H4E0_9ACTN|nr:SHOCT domain-containing protein [Kribbella steppae]TCO20442.1 phospholipase D-like protein [Kribbella steppae]